MTFEEIRRLKMFDSKMKTVILVLVYATLVTSVRDKRSYGHAQAYPVPLSVHTEVRPSNTLPIYEYPESTEINTHSKTVYSVSVPIIHTVHLEQPGHSRQVIYHNRPAHIPSYTSYNAPQVYHVPQTSVYAAPQVYRNTPQVYSSSVYSAPVYTAPRRVYNVASSPWPYRRYADPWC